MSILLFPLLCAFFVIGTLLVLTFLFIDLGLKVLGSMLAAAAVIVKQAVDRLIDALSAFVNWVIQFIKDTFNSLILQPINDLWNAIISWTLGFITLMSDNAKSVASGKKSLSNAAFEMVEYFLNNQVIQILTIIITLVAVGIAIIEPFMAPFSFVLMLIAPIIVELAIKGLAAAVEGAHWLMDTLYSAFSAFATGAHDFLSSGGVQVATTVVGVIAAWGEFFFGHIEILSVLGESKILGDKIRSAFSFIMSCVGVVIAMHDIQGPSEDEANWKMAGLCFSGVGFGLSIRAGLGTTLNKILFAFSAVGLFTNIIGVI